MKKNKIENLINEITPVVIVVLIILLAVNSMQFWKQMHSIDSVHNFHKMEIFINTLTNKTIQLEDRGSDYVSRPIDDYYIAAMKNIDRIYIQGIILSIFLGVILGIKIFRRENEKIN